MSTIPFPLFHGTSSAFLPSIFEHGLGGRNPVASARAVECLKRLITLADNHLQDQESWESKRYVLELVTQQRVTGANMNFRHGGAYCSPLENTAVKYALSNKHGSEIFSDCIGLYRELLILAPETVSFLRAEFPEIYELDKSDSLPVLLTLRDVPVDALSTEQGEDPAESIAFVSSVTTNLDMIILQQKNFELIKPVPADKITARYIDVRRKDPFFPQYVLSERPPSKN